MTPSLSNRHLQKRSCAGVPDSAGLTYALQTAVLGVDSLHSTAGVSGHCSLIEMQPQSGGLTDALAEHSTTHNKVTVLVYVELGSREPGCDGNRLRW